MIMDDALPGIKSFFKATTLKPNAVSMLVRLVAAFTCHIGRMSAAQAAGSIRTQARHRAAMVRFLAQVVIAVEIAHGVPVALVSTLSNASLVWIWLLALLILHERATSHEVLLKCGGLVGMGLGIYLLM